MILLCFVPHAHAQRHSQTTHTTPKGYHHDGTFHYEGEGVIFILLPILILVLFGIAFGIIYVKEKHPSPVRFPQLSPQLTWLNIPIDNLPLLVGVKIAAFSRRTRAFWKTSPYAIGDTAAKAIRATLDSAAKLIRSINDVCLYIGVGLILSTIPAALVIWFFSSKR